MKDSTRLKYGEKSSIFRISTRRKEHAMNVIANIRKFLKDEKVDASKAGSILARANASSPDGVKLGWSIGYVFRDRELTRAFRAARARNREHDHILRDALA